MERKDNYLHTRKLNVPGLVRIRNEIQPSAKKRRFRLTPQAVRGLGRLHETGQLTSHKAGRRLCSRIMIPLALKKGVKDSKQMEVQQVRNYRK
jgi:hypothetical protein